MKCFALVLKDTKKFTKASDLTIETLLKDLDDNSGLDFLPRARTPQGRQFEHAMTSISLIDSLINLEEAASTKDVTLTKLAQVSLKEEEDDVMLIKIDEAYLNLAIQANGKADLYFFAYFAV